MAFEDAQSFVQQFQKLLLEKPRYNLKHVMAENCDYSDTAVKSKNCYYGFGTFYCEDVYFGRYSRKCTNCSGITLCVECEFCVECIDCAKCYMCDYCQDCQNCQECQYCQDCFGCRNCFSCVGLYQKKYCILNQQYSKEEYFARMAKLDLNNPEHIGYIKQEKAKLEAQTPHIAWHQFQTEDCVGDHIVESKNCHYCYDIFASEDCLYSVEANANQTCCDINVCFESELLYQCVQSPLCYNCNFLVHVDRTKNSEFCAFSRDLENCFGCVYLERKKYHILNQPYSPDEYQKKVKEIKEVLVAAGNYNLDLYLISDYEKNRIATETDHVIQV